MVELRKRTDQLPDDYWVVLVGDMITEEALPTYMAMLNTLDGVRDETGAADTPWGRYDYSPRELVTLVHLWQAGLRVLQGIVIVCLMSSCTPLPPVHKYQ